MIQRLKNLSALKGKKRYIVFAWLAVELISLPAAAHIVTNATFEAPSTPLVIAVEIPSTTPGVSRYLVNSDAGFIVKAENMSGKVNIDVHKSGTLGNNTRFGDAAQLPGPETGCAQPEGASSKIYEALRKTEAQGGGAADRAVVFEFQYAPEHRPEFVFVAEDNTETALISCDGSPA